MQDKQDSLAPQELTDGASPATDATPATAETVGNGPDIIPSLQEQLRQLELKASEHYDAWLRAKAETENMRRRAQEDVTKAAKFAIEKFANELLSVKDSLEQTLAVNNATLESLRDGVELTLRNLARAFEKSGVEEVNPVGEKFDPHKHQAMSAVESDQPANTVLQVFQKGYALEGRILRPALVSVAKSGQ
ncbi:MAG: nucleotide exchange factor GrpE [Rhodocyclaceae bacterium]